MQLIDSETGKMSMKQMRSFWQVKKAPIDPKPTIVPIDEFDSKGSLVTSQKKRPKEI